MMTMMMMSVIFFFRRIANWSMHNFQALYAIRSNGTKQNKQKDSFSGQYLQQAFELRNSELCIASELAVL